MIRPQVLAIVKRLYEEGEYIDINPDVRIKTRSAAHYRIRANYGTVRFCSRTIVDEAARQGLIEKDWHCVFRLTVFGIVAARTGFSFLGFAYGLPQEEIDAVAARLLSSPNPRVYAAKLSAHARCQRSDLQSQTNQSRSTDRSASEQPARSTGEQARNGSVPHAPHPLGSEQSESAPERRVPSCEEGR